MSLVFVGHPKETDLALFAGGELGPLARWRIERHLQGCEWCRETVGDFFHLQGDLAELAEIPSLDWEGMTQQIRERLDESEPASPLPRRTRVRPLVWQLGFGMAAAVSVVAVLNLIPERSAVSEPVNMFAAENKPVVALSATESDQLHGSLDRLDESESVRGVGHAEDGFAKDLGVRAVSAPVEKSARRRDVLRPVAPNKRFEAKEELAGAETGSLPGDVSRPSGPVLLEAGAGNYRAAEEAPRVEERRQQFAAVSPDKSAADKKMAEAISPAPAYRRHARARARSLSSAGMTVTGGLSIVPASFGEADVEVGVTADGWLRFRSVDSATGNITITHVYAQ